MPAGDELVRQILESLDDGVLLAQAAEDPAGGAIVATNAVMATLAGTRQDQLEGESPLGLASRGLDDVTTARIRNAIALGQPFRGDTVWRMPGGDPVPVEVVLAPLTNGTGEVSRWVWLFRDLQERRLLERQIWQSQRMETVGLLAHGIAHEFNNILTALTGYTGFLLQGLAPDDPRRADALQIERAAEQAAMLIDQLLSFSRRDPPRPRVIQLNRALEDLVPILERLAGEHIHVVLELAEFSGGILADERQLQQIIFNLVANSRDAMPQGGTVILATASTGSDLVLPGSLLDRVAGAHVLLSVTDTGRGMDAETRAQLFKPFFTTKDREESAGMGLATVHGLVRQLGGYVWVNSEVAQGTTVRVYFPIAGTAESREEQSPGTDAPPVGGDETILLVEDQPAILSLVRRLLENFGYRVIPAGSAAEATALAGELGSQVDLLLTDVVMPGQHGPDLAAELQQDHPDLRVLCISGYPDGGARTAAVDRFPTLEKPFTADELARTVRAILDAPERA